MLSFAVHGTDDHNNVNLYNAAMHNVIKVSYNVEEFLQKQPHTTLTLIGGCIFVRLYVFYKIAPSAPFL